MYTLGFLSPYKHLPEFTKFVHNTFICKTIKSFADIDTDYVFYAPNYTLGVLKDVHLVGTNVRGILTPSTGINHIEVKNTPVYSIKNHPILNEIYSTAEHNIYLCLHITRQVPPILELKESVLGILGYGRLGKMVDNIGTSLFAKVEIKDEFFRSSGFFETTDFLSINIDYKKENIKFVNREFITKFKKNIFIVNTSRGEVVNEQDILDLILEGKVLGYATDVISDEHDKPNSPILRSKSAKVFVTPHVGGTAIHAQEKAYREVLNYIL